MSENKPLPAFDSTEDLVEFFDSNDIGDFDLPEVEFEVDVLTSQSHFSYWLESSAQHDIDVKNFVDSWMPKLVPKEEARQSSSMSAVFPSPAEGWGFSLLLAAPVLYGWAKIQLEYLRSKRENDIARQRIEMKLWLVEEKKLPVDLAEALVDKTLDAISERNVNDPALQKILTQAKKSSYRVE